MAPGSESQVRQRPQSKEPNLCPEPFSSPPPPNFQGKICHLLYSHCTRLRGGSSSSAGRKKGKKLAWEKRGSRPGELRRPPSAPSPQPWAPPQPACPRAPAVPLSCPGPHGLLLPRAHRRALTPKLSSAPETPPRASTCSLSHRVWSLQLQRQSCREPGISVATFIL